MRIEEWRKNQQGFTLIEMMVSASLLALALIAVSSEFVMQRKAERSGMLQQSARSALSLIATNVWTSLGSFPDIMSGTTHAVYIGCFDSTLALISGTNGPGWVTQFTAVPTSPPKPIYCGLAASIQQYPSLGNAFYEIHVTHTNAHNIVSQAEVYGYVVPRVNQPTAAVSFFQFSQIAGIVQATQIPATGNLGTINLPN